MSNTPNDTQRAASDSSSMTLQASSSQLRNEPSTSRRSSSRAPASWEQMRGGGHRLWYWLAISCCALSLGLLLIGLRASSSAPAVAAKRIDQIQVGDRVPTDTERGDNDLRFGEDVDPATWRQLELTAPKTDGTVARVTLLRPLTWLKDQHARVGGTVTFAVPECGILGDARVDAIHPCPPIRGAQGRVVTGIFRHQSAEILELKLASGETIRTTPNHRFWSETRQDYVPAEALQRDEKLRDGSGSSIAIVDIERLGQPHPVFNLEVQADHVFFVGKSGTLVHNSNPCDVEIGLGKQPWLKELPKGVRFAKEGVNTPGWTHAGLTLFDSNGPSTFGGAFRESIRKAKRIHFSLKNVSVQKAWMRIKPKTPASSYIKSKLVTEWELRQIMGNRDAFNRTVFHLNGRTYQGDEAWELLLALLRREAAK